MKKLIFISLIFVFTLFVSLNEPVQALNGSIIYLNDTDSNRFSYLENSYGGSTVLSLEFEFFLNPVLTEYVIVIEQVDYEGEYIRFLYSEDIFPSIYDTRNFLIEYDFNNIILTDEIAFYSIRYGTNILYSGAVMTHPDYISNDLTFNSEQVEIGDYVYNVDATAVSYEQEPYTYNYDDDFVILHYRFSDYVETNPFDYLFVKFHNLENLTVAKSINYIDIEDAQIYSISMDREFTRNNFVILPINGFLPPFLNTDDQDINDSYEPLISYLPDGAYSVAITDDSDNFNTGSQTPLIILEESDVLTFSLSLDQSSYSITDEINVNFIKNSINVANAYKTEIAYDDTYFPEYLFGEIDSTSELIDIIDEKDRTITINYDVEENVTDNLIGKISWFIRPKQLPYEFDDFRFLIRVEVDYVIDDSTLFDANVNNFLNNNNFNNASGLVLIISLIFIAMNIIMAKYVPNLGVISFMNMFLLVFFIFIGWISLWISVLLGLIIIIGIILSFSGGGGSDE